MELVRVVMTSADAYRPETTPAAVVPWHVYALGSSRYVRGRWRLEEAYKACLAFIHGTHPLQRALIIISSSKSNSSILLPKSQSLPPLPSLVSSRRHGVQQGLHLVVCATDRVLCSSAKKLHSPRRPPLCQLLRQDVPQRAGDRALRDGVEGGHPAVHGARRAPPLLP
jgi:hypothetical protein